MLLRDDDALAFAVRRGVAWSRDAAGWSRDAEPSTSPGSSAAARRASTDLLNMALSTSTSGSSPYAMDMAAFWRWSYTGVKGADIGGEVRRRRGN